MLATPVPVAPRTMGNEAWMECVELLNNIFTCYARSYFAAPGEAQTEEWFQARRVAMPAFLHYFNTGVIATTHQVANRIRRYLTPFDLEIEDLLGLNATTCLQICEGIADAAQTDADELQRVLRAEKSLRLELLDRAAAENWPIEKLREETQKTNYRAIAEDMFRRQSDLLCIRSNDLEARFGAAGIAFWERFSVRRGEVERVNYLTDTMAIDRRPLIRIGESDARYFVPNSLYVAVLDVVEAALLGSAHKSAFLRARDRILEEQAAAAFKLLAPAAICHPSVYETPDNQHEHDLVAIAGRTAFVVEMKASPPPEPFRDPDKAFQRVRHAFASDKGPQKAYEQARRLWRRWRAGKPLELFNARREHVVTVAANDLDEVFMIGVTRDDYGPLGSDLSLLLEREPDEPYPWIIDAYALEAMADGWAYFGWGVPQLVEFLKTRIRLHGSVMGSDELEFAGYYIRHGFDGLPRRDFDIQSLDPHYSNVFSDIWLATHYNGPAVTVVRTPAYFDDMGKMLGAKAPPGTASGQQKLGRNDPCRCGSGKKFKKCHGRPQSPA